VVRVLTLILSLRWCLRNSGSRNGVVEFTTPHDHTQGFDFYPNHSGAVLNIYIQGYPRTHFRLERETPNDSGAVRYPFKLMGHKQAFDP